MILMMGTALLGQDVAGHYVLRGEREIGSEMLLHPGGQFEYMFVYGAAEYRAKGTWRIQDGSVVLNTEAPEAPPFRLVKSGNTADQAVRVWVKAPGGQAVPNIDVAVKMDGETKRSRTSGDGAAEFPPSGQSRAVTFSIPVYSLEDGPYPLDPAQNEYVFEINGEAITTVRFKDEKLALDGKNLVLRFWSKAHAMRYERE